MPTEKKMSVDEALALIRKTHPNPNLKIVGFMEFDKFYVFGIVSKDAKPDYNGHYFITNGQKINRYTGEISRFFPPHENKSDFKNGRKIDLE